MRLKILGTRGNIPLSARGYARHSGILLDARILLDFGEVEYLRYRPRHIFVTHLHPDHAAFLRSDVTTGAQIFVPEPTRRLPQARVISRAVRTGAYRIVPVPTRHSAKVRSLGYIIQKSGRRVFYSSDMVAIDRRYWQHLRRLDLVITDGSYMRRGGLVRRDPESGARFGHLGIPDLVTLFRPCTPRIVFTHFGSWFYKDIRASKRRIASLGNGVTVSAARDGLVLEV